MVARAKLLVLTGRQTMLPLAPSVQMQASPHAPRPRGTTSGSVLHQIRDRRDGDSGDGLCEMNRHARGRG